MMEEEKKEALHIGIKNLECLVPAVIPVRFMRSLKGN